MSNDIANERVKLDRDLRALKEADRMLWMTSIIRSEAKWAVVWNGRYAVAQSVAERIGYMGGMAGAW